MPDSSVFQFARQASGIYYAQSRQGQFTALDRRVAFIALAGNAGAALTLSQSWSLPAGVYLFLGEMVRDEAGFLATVLAQFQEPTFGLARILWLANPNARRDQWQLSAVRMMGLSAAGGAVAALTSFGFRNFGVGFEQGALAGLDESAPAFTISAPPGRPGALFLTARNGALRLNQIAGPVRIPLAGDAGTGCLCFGLAVLPGQQQTFDIGCRFYYPAYSLQGREVLTSLSYPIFDTAKSGFTLEASLDPLAPASPARTSFAFPADAAAMPSFYRSNVGRPVQLTPTPGSRLVFGARNTFATASPRDPLSLTPDGPFQVATDGELPNVMCGSSGTEFIELDKDSLLTFVAGQNAYLPSFDARTGIPASEFAAVPQFAGPATTSFASVGSPGSRLCYSAVPEGAGYFGGAAPQTRMRRYFPACAAFLPQPSSDPPEGYPMVPYAGVLAADLTAHRLMETEVLSHLRRERIHGVDTGAPLPAVTHTLLADAAAEATTITPQGLLATFSADRATWSLLKIAQTAVGKDAAGAPLFAPLAFQSIDEPLRSGLLTPQQFLVISDAQAFQRYFGLDNIAEIEGWRFLLDPAGWNRFGTILIIKNHVRSLKDLVEDVPKWTFANRFNLSTSNTQQRLRAIIAAAESEAAAPGSDFQAFVDDVRDPNWNGILFLNCPLSAADLPADLEVLAAGIDPAGFVAHHFGVNQTPVSEADLELKHSSLFGLIHYQSASGSRSFGSYDFRVTSLRVLFENSVVTRLAAIVELTLNELFGSRSNAPPITLNGSYEKHGDSRAFVLAGDAPSVFALDDKVLESVTVTKTRVATRFTDADGVEARFTFWGSLKFRALQSAEGVCDLFSYDALSFSSLALAMSFERSDPTTRTFEFDPSELVLDASQSVARAGSLARQFPLKLKRFLLSDGVDKLPTGYASVDVPLDRQKPAAPWFGLVFDLNLGTLGDLAGGAGITASMVMVWSAAASGLPIFTGLKIPGLTGGGSQFSLMGILKLKMSSLELAGSDGAFQLMLNGISLSLMGKSLPPGASFDFFVFGDPDPSAGSDALGWYGAFKKAAGG